MAVEDKRRLVGELLKRAASGELTLPVEQIFALDDIAQAAKAGAGSGRNGKVLLRP
jgi:NADPH:quinone reductase-like Zn-dependent oxidoreductase